MLRLGCALALSSCLLACGGAEFTPGGEGGSGATGATSGGGDGSGASGSGASGTGASGGGGDECPPSAACVPEPPDGWEGPAVLYAGEAPPPACPDDWKTEVTGRVGDPEAPHSCSPCECDAPVGATCGTVSVSLFTGGTCASVPTIIQVPSDGSCVPVPEPGYGVKAGPLPSSGGACTATGGIPSADDPTWPEETVVCGEPQSIGKCADGEICAPKAEAPFDAATCVYKEGDHECPSGFPARKLMHEGFIDDRSCTDCSCGTPTGVTCGGFFGYTNDECSAVDPPEVPLDGSCQNEAGFYAGLQFEGKTTGGSCAASGGEPTGGVTPASPVTVCCSR